jgi:molybdenum cofactor guanylyltransferase
MGGRDKALLEIDGVTILERQLAVLRPLFAEVMVVAGDPERYRGTIDRALLDGDPVRLIRDRDPDAGPLAGMDGALAASAADALVVVACDLPFLDARLITLVRDRDPDAQAVVPRVAGRPQALHARYARSVAPLVRARLDRGALRVLDLLQELQVSYLDEPELGDVRGLTNVNTPEQLESLKK